MRLWRSATTAAGTLIAAWLGGCAPSGDACTPGDVNCACAARGRCLTGLECIDGICTDPGGGGLDAGGGGSMDAGGGGFVDAGPEGPPDVGPNPDAFFAEDPPPMLCLEDGGMGPPADPPGGTPECPDDKNREGCRCDEVGATAPCWPG